MENIPPTYEVATSHDHWVLIAPYIRSQDLSSTALVCSRWHEIFAPQLWGNPASHFRMDDDDAVYVALTRFRRTLLWARLYLRRMTHTLTLPPAHSELYEGPHSDWLRDVLERLPRLQSLIVNGLPFFDHAALLTLRYVSRSPQQNTNTFPTFGLRFLDARRCSNATSIGLAEALRHLPDLLYLDLTGTLAAKAPAVLTRIGSLPSLQVLKLCSLGLRDEEVSVLTSTLGLRIRSLDLRNNKLTDASARSLLMRCIKGPHGPPVDNPYLSSHGQFTSLQDPDYHGDVIRYHHDEELDIYLRNRLTTGIVDRLAVEDTDETGITHLYISNNCMSAEGLSGLLRSRQLHILDCGDVSRSLRDVDHGSHLASADPYLALPGVAKLTTVIASLTSRNLTYLRIHHGIVTENTPEMPVEEAAIINQPSTPVELHGTSIGSRQGYAYELSSGSTVPLVELDAVPTVAELPADSAQIFELPASPLTNHMPAPTFERSTSGTSRFSWVVGDDSAIDQLDEESLEDANDLQPSLVLGAGGHELTAEATAMNGQSSRTVPPEKTSLSVPKYVTRQRTYSSIVDERRRRATLHQAQHHGLRPSMTPRLQTLVLTDVPASTPTLEPVNKLIDFITDCAEESELARLQAHLGYAMPPGQRGRLTAQREYAQSIFALRCIVLELAPPQPDQRKAATGWRRYPTKSSTEDADSEAFWTAAEHDFSFFADEECGQYESGNRMVPGSSEKMLVTADDEAAMNMHAFGSEECDVSTPRYDLVAELSKFRRARKALHEAAVRAGNPAPGIEGYWEGEIKVIRPNPA